MNSAKFGPPPPPPKIYLIDFLRIFVRKSRFSKICGFGAFSVFVSRKSCRGNQRVPSPPKLHNPSVVARKDTAQTTSTFAPSHRGKDQPCKKSGRNCLGSQPRQSVSSRVATTSTYPSPENFSHEQDLHDWSGVWGMTGQEPSIQTATQGTDWSTPFSVHRFP